MSNQPHWPGQGLPPVQANRPPPLAPQMPRFNYPPPPPPSGGGFGRQLLGMVGWGAGIAIALTAFGALFGPRRTTQVHHYESAPPHAASAAATPAHKKPAANPALTRPIFNCAVEEDVLQQCLAAGGDCRVYQQRVDVCHKKQAEGTL